MDLWEGQTGEESLGGGREGKTHRTSKQPHQQLQIRLIIISIKFFTYIHLITII